ncbi:MAG: hypothetical protein GY865_09095, partial [candidate division Zixibacteria bacterium]|nr:hypothetical protein [candidate division Zixibacteria bacterium]
MIVYNIIPNSGVPEAAYLIKTDDLIIYHGGDYKGSVKNDMEYLTRKIDHIDIAMINDHCGDEVMSIIEDFQTKMIFAGHYGGQEEDLESIS